VLPRLRRFVQSSASGDVSLWAALASALFRGGEELDDTDRRRRRDAVPAERRRQADRRHDELRDCHGHARLLVLPRPGRLAAGRRHGGSSLRGLLGGRGHGGVFGGVSADDVLQLVAVLLLPALDGQDERKPVQFAGVGGVEDADRVADGGEVGATDADGVRAGILDVVAAPDPAPLVFAGDDLELELDVASAAVAGGLHVRVGDDGLVLAFGQGLELLGGLHFIGVEIDGCHC
jgi:hypothetical protein